MGLFSKKDSTAVGIDIGTTTVKVVELSKGADGPVMTNYGILESLGKANQPSHVLQTSGSNVVEAELVQYLDTLKKKLNLKTDKVHISLPAFASFTALLKIPKMGQGGTNKEVLTQASQHIPLPIETATLDWIKTGEYEADETKMQTILVVSVPNERVTAYATLFGKAGLHVESFEVETISAARALTLGNEKPTLIIDIGGRSTTITAAKNGLAMLSAQTDLASNTLTQALSKALTISLVRAEKMKRKARIVENPGSHELSTALLPTLDGILKEAARVQQSFQQTYGEAIQVISLTGSGAEMPGFAEYVFKKLGVPVVKNNGLQAVKHKENIQKIRPPLGTVLTVATGLALKGIT